MAETTFKYQSKKQWEGGSFDQINTGEKKEWQYFRKEMGMPQAETEVTVEPVKEDKDPEWIKEGKAKEKECTCGAIKRLRSGIKDGKKWAGWFCDDKQCQNSPEWVNLTKR